MQRSIKLLPFISVVFLLSTACASDYATRRAYFEQDSSRRSAEVHKSKRSNRLYQGLTFEGRCSYYGKKFHGRQTASGESFNMYAKTAAHRKLPFNTIVKVTNLKNNKSVRVRINDRGPFKKDRIIDVSYGAARYLNMIQDGTVPVQLKIVQLPTKN